MKEKTLLNPSPSDRGLEECYHIAESMIEELHLLAIPEGRAQVSGDGRHKGSLKRRLLRQIRQAKRMAMMG